MSKLSIVPLDVADVEHRQFFERYVLDHAQPWHRAHLGRFYEFWNQSNSEYFEGAMTVPYVLLCEPGSPRRYGDCARISGFGGRSQIRLRPSLLTGTHYIAETLRPNLIENVLSPTRILLQENTMRGFQRYVSTFGGSKTKSPLTDGPTVMRLHRAISGAVRAGGERMAAAEAGGFESANSKLALDLVDINRGVLDGIVQKAGYDQF